MIEQEQAAPAAETEPLNDSPVPKEGEVAKETEPEVEAEIEVETPEAEVEDEPAPTKQQAPVEAAPRNRPTPEYREDTGEAAHLSNVRYYQQWEARFREQLDDEGFQDLKPSAQEDLRQKYNQAKAGRVRAENLLHQHKTESAEEGIVSRLATWADDAAAEVVSRVPTLKGREDAIAMLIVRDKGIRKLASTNGAQAIEAIKAKLGTGKPASMVATRPAKKAPAGVGPSRGGGGGGVKPGGAPTPKGFSAEDMQILSQLGAPSTFSDEDKRAAIADFKRYKK